MRYADKGYPMQQLVCNNRKKLVWNENAQKAFDIIKRELWEASVLGMPTEKGIYALDTDAGILHQEQDCNRRTVLRPIAYGNKYWAIRRRSMVGQKQNCLR